MHSLAAGQAVNVLTGSAESPRSRLLHVEVEPKESDIVSAGRNPITTYDQRTSFGTPRRRRRRAVASATHSAGAVGDASVSSCWLRWLGRGVGCTPLTLRQEEQESPLWRLWPYLQGILVVGAVIDRIIYRVFTVTWQEFHQPEANGLCQAGAVVDTCIGLMQVPIILYSLRAARGAYCTVSEMPDRPWQTLDILELAARRWCVFSGCAIALESGWMLYRNFDVGIRTFFSNSQLQLVFASSNFLTGTIVVAVQWALIAILGWVCSITSNWMAVIATNASNQPVTSTLDSYYLLRHDHAECLRCILQGHFLSWALLWYI
eukprot:COSAG01_NODE_14449_length_1452_cov_2.608278_2_plen_318_part_01